MAQKKTEPQELKDRKNRQIEQKKPNQETVIKKNMEIEQKFDL